MSPPIVRRFLVSIDTIDQKVTGTDLNKVENEWYRHHSSILKYIASFRCSLCSERKLDGTDYCVAHIKTKKESYERYKAIEDDIIKVLSENKTTMTIEHIRKGIFRKEDFLTWKQIGGFAILINNIIQARRQFQLTYHANDKDDNHELIIQNYEKLSNILNDIKVVTVITTDIIPCPIMIQSAKKVSPKTKKQKKSKKKKSVAKPSPKQEDILESYISINNDCEVICSYVSPTEGVTIWSNLYVWNLSLGFSSSVHFKETFRQEVVKEIDIDKKIVYFSSGRNISILPDNHWIDDKEELISYKVFKSESEGKEYKLIRDILDEAFNYLSDYTICLSKFNSDEFDNGLYFRHINRWTIKTDFQKKHASVTMNPNLIRSLDKIAKEWIHILIDNEDLITDDEELKQAKNSYVADIFNQIVSETQNKYTEDIKRIKLLYPFLDSKENKCYIVDISSNIKNFKNDYNLIFDSSDDYLNLFHLLDDYIRKIIVLLGTIDTIYMKGIITKLEMSSLRGFLED